MNRPQMKNARVGNAADPSQVLEAGLKDTLAMRDSERCWAAILSIPEGRALLWEIMGYTGLHRSITRTSSEIYVLTGMRDVGLWVQGRILETDEDAYLTMQKESYNAARKEVSGRTLKESLADQESGQ